MSTMMDAKGRDDLSGARKAATIMLMLGEERSAPIWEHLDEEEVKRLSLAMAELGTVPRSSIEAIAEEFAQNLSEQDRIVGNYDRTEAFLRGVLPKEKADVIMDEIRGQASRNVWHKLSSVDVSLLSAYLKGEHPQTVALILSRLPAEISAKTLALLDESFATEILNRMLTLNNVQREALESVEQVLHAEFLSGLSRTQRRDSHEAIAEVFNNLDRQSERRLMIALERTNEAAATRIKELMFTFEDLTNLGPAAIQTLLRTLDKGLLARALKGANDKAREAFTTNMSSRAAKLFMDDLEALGPMRLRDVDQAQATVIQIAKELEARGEIMIGRNRDDEFV
ncbi:flagellar motor switch protein FliG [Enterovirga sp. CN4-39]|uniref:flagellar motor switch protein FliG n=1 Tax=Enterovirga sp. CN4-39 TaxID=3400910 RepID=UPI003C11BEC8